MANFAAVLDPDHGRRSRFLDTARNVVGVRVGLVLDDVEVGTFAAVWATAPSAPVAAWHDTTGAAAVFGDLRRPSSSERLGAEALHEHWTHDQAWAGDGFHAAVSYRSPGELVVGCDVLGLFPVYFWSDGHEVTVVASSPGTIACHPSFRPETSIGGLAGVLLTGGPLDGRTLWSGVKRLSPGHLLITRRDQRPTEVLQFDLPVGDDSPLRVEEAVEAYHAGMGGAVQRSAPPDRAHTVLLSGGRDSRLVAGYLRQANRSGRMLTLGRPGDHEARCAKAVCRSLGEPHRVAEVELDRFPEYARLHARTEHLMGNASGSYTWGIGDVLGAGEGDVVSGHGIELTGGGVHLAWAGVSSSGEASWEAFRQTMATHAIEPSLLTRLVRDPELRDTVHELDDGLPRSFAGFGASVESRALGFLWKHWGRHHSGAVPWRLSFSAWPILPILDQELLGIAARVPPELAAGRRLQDEVLSLHHPDLARAPLVRPSGSLEPVDVGPGWRIGRGWERLSSEVTVRLPGGGRPIPERRYYRRMYDPDNAGWVAVRRAAEPYREALHDWFHPDVLRELVPEPEHPMALERPIADGFGRKTLLGLMLWAGHGTPEEGAPR